MRRGSLRWWQEILLLIGIAFFLAVVVRNFAFQAFVIPSGSMGPTVQVGDRLLVNKMVYGFRTPDRGEVVVFTGPPGWVPESPGTEPSGPLSSLGGAVENLIGVGRPGEHDFIKRVIGLPGDTVACCDVDGRVIVNGQGIDEPYVRANAPRDAVAGASKCATRSFNPVVVQPGEMFVLGDHRVDSQDSRCRGQVPLTNVLGQAVAIVWPAGHWATLGAPESFADIPKPLALAEVNARVAGTGGGPVPVPVADPGIGFAIPLVLAFGFVARSRGRPRRRRRTLLS